MAQGVSRAWFIAPAVVLLLAALTLWSVKSQQRVVNALGGTQDAVATLKVEGADVDAAAPLLLERLRILGVSAQVLETRGKKLVLRLLQVAEPEVALHGVLEPTALRFVHLPRNPGEDAGAGRQPFVKGTSRKEVLDKAAQTPSVLECLAPQRGGPTLCAAWQTAPVPLTRAHVKAVTLTAEPRTEEPLITVSFTEEGARIFAELSRTLSGEALGIVALGELQARPELTAPVEDGIWRFSTRTGDTTRNEAVARAQRINAAAVLPDLPAIERVRVEPLP